MKKMILLLIGILIISSVGIYAQERVNCIDEDGDGYGDGCSLGLDCNDNNPYEWQVQVCFIDNDGDSYNRWFGYTCYGGIGEFCYCGNGSIHKECNTDYYPFTSEVPQGIDYCDDNPLAHTEEGCKTGSQENFSVPEFTFIGASIVLLGAGLLILKRRK